MTENANGCLASRVFMQEKQLFLIPDGGALQQEQEGGWEVLTTGAKETSRRTKNKLVDRDG